MWKIYLIKEFDITSSLFFVIRWNWNVWVFTVESSETTTLSCILMNQDLRIFDPSSDTLTCLPKRETTKTKDKDESSVNNQDCVVMLAELSEDVNTQLLNFSFAIRSTGDIVKGRKSSKFLSLFSWLFFCLTKTVSTTSTQSTVDTSVYKVCQSASRIFHNIWSCQSLICSLVSLFKTMSPDNFVVSTFSTVDDAELRMKFNCNKATVIKSLHSLINVE